MIKKRILGLDLGTNSIGWAVVSRTTENIRENGEHYNRERYQPEQEGAVIFSEGVKIEKGNESSKAAERTAHRSARRLNFRRKLRKFETLKVLVEHGMCPLSMKELMNWRSSVNPENGKRQTFNQFPQSEGFINWLLTDNRGDQKQRKEGKKNPYYFRAQGLDHKLNPEQLGRAFYHMAQRRGFLSNRLDTADSSLLENLMPAFQGGLDQAGDLQDLEARLNDIYPHEELDQEEYKDVKKLKRSFDGIIKNNKTLPLEELIEKLDKRLNRKENLGAVKQGISDLSEKIEASGSRTLGEYFYRAIHKGEKVRTHYTAREEHYLDEFHKLCEAQDLSDTLRKKLERAIFYQRPLKSQKGTVGKCTMEPTKPRCPVSHPDFEKFRMLSFVNSIRIKAPEDERLRELNEEERQKAMAKFYRVSQNFPFETIAKELAPKHDYAYFKGKEKAGKSHHFNYQMNHSVGACPVSNTMKRLLGDDWEEKVLEYEVEKTQRKKEKRQVSYHDLWHVLFTFDSYDKLYEYVTQKLKLSEAKAAVFARTILKKDYAALSLKAIRNINPWLEQGLIYPMAVFLAKLPEIIDADKWKDNEELLIRNIKELIEGDKTDRRHTQIANELWSAFKEKYPHKHHPKYELDRLDIEDIKAKIYAHYGEEHFKGMQEEKQRWIRVDIEERFLKSLRSGKFGEKKRLDEKIRAFILDHDLCSDEKRLYKMYHPSDIEAYPKREPDHEGNINLGSPRSNSVRNPMAMRALFQLRKLVNQLLKDGLIDTDTEIHIELARELNDANKRKALQKWQKRQEAEKEEYRKKIAELYLDECGKEVVINELDVLRYKLREEQRGVCIYTGDMISICDIIGKNPKYDFEHTLPRSLSEDNSQMNLTLCNIDYNRKVKKNRIPRECPDFEEMKERVRHWKDHYEELDKQMEAQTRAVKAATTKEAKDARIERRHLLRLERDYYGGKYERFTAEEITSGFKNSQQVDVGIISRLSRAYMRSVFDTVISVKGSLVDEFRKAWGLHEPELDEEGKPVIDMYGDPVYKAKDRSNHTQHIKDAVVIACMSKKMYDLMAHAWRLQEQEKHKEARVLLADSKPWPGFTKDMKALKKETLVYHHNPDHVGKKSRKKWKKRGVVQQNKAGEPIYLKGEGVRGSLHKDTLYGSILRTEMDKNGIPVLNQEGKAKKKLHYVVRKELALLKTPDIKNIVDEQVQEIVKEGRKKEEMLQKEIKVLQKKLKTAEEHEEQGYQEEIKSIKDRIANEIYVMRDKSGAISMRDGRPVPIKKVRCYQPTVTDPIHLKRHLNQSRHAHKQHVHVMNDENYLFLIYEGLNKAGKLKRKHQVVNMLDTAGGLDNLSEKMDGLSLAMQVKKGDMVLFYKEHPDELKPLVHTAEILKRLYKVVKLDKTGRLFFRYHTEAKPASDLGLRYSIDVNEPFEQLRLTSANWNFIVAGDGFDLSRSGEISFNF